MCSRAGSPSGSITFSGTGGVLQIDGADLPTDPAKVIAATVSGFASGDTIDLTGIVFTGAGQANLTGSNELQITEGGNTYDLQLDPSQVFNGDYFHLISDGGSGTDVVERDAMLLPPVR